MDNKFLRLPVKTYLLSIMLACATSSDVFAAYTETNAPAANACAIPTTPASTQEETAWQLFVAANCKIANNQLTWETWKTQACLNNPADCTTRKLHGSFLRARLAAAHAKLKASDGPRRTGACSPMTTTASADPSLLPFVPTNLSGDPEFCEEVTINPSEETYATTNGLLTETGQVAFLQSGGTINFPTGAIEVKADWVAASSYKGVTFDCTKPNTTIYQEKIDGTCYALTGIHISSKLYPNWVWATFEPQDTRTNPNRCNPKLYNACVDNWGSNPATSSGSNTKPTTSLAALFSAAGAALDPSFQNYRLTGTQTVYSQPTGSNGVLGSSFVEFNADVPAQQASCITCHNYAQRQPTPLPAGSTPPGSAPAGSANVGTPTPLPPAYKPLDFSWFLGFGVPQGNPICKDVNAGPIFNNNDAKAKCPTVCAKTSTTWNGQWKTTVEGKMSVCGCCN